MPKLDSQGRLSIPYELREKISFPICGSVAICFESNRIIIVKEIEYSFHNVIAFRKVDQKGRIFLPKEVLNILDAHIGDMLIVSLYQEQICVSKK